MKSHKFILNSRGLNTIAGTRQIANGLEQIFDEEPLGNKKILLVIPPDYTDFGVGDLLVESCLELGFARENIIFSKDFKADEAAPNEIDVIYVSEGNTFEILDYIRKNNLVEFIRKQVIENDAVYIGSSAGALIATSDIELALDFDLNFVGMTDFTGLQLLDKKCTILPHYEPHEAKRYFNNCEKSFVEKYETLYSVGNDSWLVL